jgi:hypothetical protein
MANTRTSRERAEVVVIDEAPGADGYFTSPVNTRKKNIGGKVYLAIRGTFEGTVTLQFKCQEDTDWTDYGTYTTTGRKAIEDHGVTQWRIGVASGDYTSGTVTCGIDW